VVGVLWFCGFFNYADRQAVTSVFPLLQVEFGLSKAQQGMIGSAFMVVYACAAPLAGYVVDLASRRLLIVLGLAFWSVVCAATALARSFNQLLFFRAAEGLGESFYFPASVSLLADYHGARTRSRAMSVHQTSVYAGTALGGALAGYLGERFGWRSPFWILGFLGLFYAIVVLRHVVEPGRGDSDAAGPAETELPPPVAGNLWDRIATIVRIPAAAALLAVFAGANFVAMALITWLTSFVKETYAMDLTLSALTANIPMQSGSLAGVLIGGVLADRAARRAGGRIRVQALGLLLGAPCVYFVGVTRSVPVLIVALAAVGICKGLYDANIFASLYDLVPVHVRGTAAGLMNTIGWAGASLAPPIIGLVADRFGLSPAIAWTAIIYVVVGILAIVASRLAASGAKPAVR
jgi:MFS family permease